MSSSQHTSPEPAGRPTTSPWSLWSSWLTSDLDNLVLLDGQLVWVSQPAGEGSVVWRLPLSEVGRTPPRALASFSSDLDYRWLHGQERRDGDPCLTAYTMHRLIANAGWIYFDHPEGFARLPLTGGDAEVIALIAPNDPRRVTSLAWIDGALWLAGWLDTDDASDPYDPGGAHDACRTRAFVARVEHGKASTRWEVPTRRWPCVQLVADQHGAWLLADDRLFRVTADGGVPLASHPRICQLHALASGLYATVVPGALVRLDSQTGELDATIVSGMPEELRSVCQAGDWICVSAGRELVAVRPDGRDLRSVLVTHGQIADLCSEGQFVYWRDNSKRAVCRVPLGTDGAPLPMPVSVTTEEPEQGVAGYEVGQLAFGDDRRLEESADVHHRRAEPATERVSSRLRAAPRRKITSSSCSAWRCSPSATRSSVLCPGDRRGRRPDNRGRRASNSIARSR